MSEWFFKFILFTLPFGYKGPPVRVATAVFSFQTQPVVALWSKFANLKIVCYLFLSAFGCVRRDRFGPRSKVLQRLFVLWESSLIWSGCTSGATSGCILSNIVVVICAAVGQCVTVQLVCHVDLRFDNSQTAIRKRGGGVKIERRFNLVQFFPTFRKFLSRTRHVNLKYTTVIKSQLKKSNNNGKQNGRNTAVKWS